MLLHQFNYIRKTLRMAINPWVKVWIQRHVRVSDDINGK